MLMSRYVKLVRVNQKPHERFLVVGFVRKVGEDDDARFLGMERTGEGAPE